ncbi:MAG: ATP-binding protein, partial [Magnetococcales bacterium]|nr:ATP-binding protein [Magnetococcales bacterium]
EELSVAEKAHSHVPLFGLIQDYETTFVDDESGTYWRKAPVIGAVGNPPEKEETFDLIAKLNAHVCMATAAVAASGASFKAVPVVTLKLDVEQRELIYEVHRVSDWVFTVDRHMGIEFFDHGGLKDRPDYLIDFVSGASSLSAYNLIVSSRSTEELEIMLRPVLENHGLSATGKHAIKVLLYLRSLSGQLALKLISSPTQQTEALGLALARLYLEYQGALSNQIILPLDAHTDLYRGSGQTDEIEDAISLQRTDLALFDLDLANRTVTCNLVEVKCYSQVGDFSAFNQLKEKITGQISQSERILQRHFDPGLKKPDRPDRLLKSREFAKTLQFYLERSLRYGIMEPETAHEAHQFLQSIERGYALQFRRSAIIFDFDKQGTEPFETEVGIEFHRVGRDLIQALLEGCDTSTRSEGGQELAFERSLSELSLPHVPKLESAAFIAPKRERTGTWTLTANDFHPEVAVESLPVSADKGSFAEFCDGAHEEEFSFSATTKTPAAENASKPYRYDLNMKIADPKEKEISILAAITRDAEQAKVVGPQTNDLHDSQQVAYDVMLGVTGESPQYGLLGEVSGRKIALDLNHTHTISLFGVQGGGKSYTLGTVIEMASMAVLNLNVLPSSLATVIFHYSPTQDYAPEFTSMIHQNSVEEEVQILRDRYKANPQALKDVVILTPADKVAERKAEYPDLEVYPIAFSAGELKATHWKFLMGAIGSQSMYMRQINLIMRGLRSNLTLDSIRSGIENSGLSDHLKDLAKTRLQFAGEYISDGQRLQDLIRPGRLIIVDLRDEYIEKDEALGLFVVMLQIFSEATFNGQAFNKMVVFDEAHKYIENDDLVTGLVEVVREMRHKGTSIMVASQDPPSVPISLIELSSQIIMHKFNSPAWLKHIQKANAALGELTSEKMSRLGTGEAYVWSSKASDDTFSKGAVKVKCRPRVTQHGGSTKTAIAG